ncbi:lipocalin family protein [Sinomicrobium sp. M5D2P17]
MKTILSMFFAVSLALGCSEDTDITEVSVIGKWQMTESYVGTGAEDTRWKKVEEGAIYQFKADSTFSSNATDCPEGKFSIRRDTLQLDFNCNYSTEPQYILFNFKGGDLIFNPLGPPYCIEGCQYRYEKMD